MKKPLNRLPRADRCELHILARITFEAEPGKNDSCLSNILNISVTGSLVETGTPIPLGSLVNFSFCIPGSNRLINIAGEVVRGARAADKQPASLSGREARRQLNRFGVMFLDVKEEDMRSMEDFFALCRAQQLDAEDEEKAGKNKV